MVRGLKSFAHAKACTVLAAALLAAGCDKVPLLAPTQSTITLTATTTRAGLNSTVEIAATVLEQSGTPVQDGTLVTFTSTLGTLEPREATTVRGVANTRLLTGSVSGIARVNASSGSARTASTSTGTGTSSTAASELQIQIGSAAANSVIVSASPSSVRSTGGSVDVIAGVLDEAGNRLLGVVVSFSTTAGSLSSSNASTGTSGDAIVQLTTNREATVTASAGGKTATTTVKVNTAPSVAFSNQSPSSPGAGQAVSFTLTPASGTTPSVTINWGDGSSQTLGVLSAARIIAHTYTTQGTYTITAVATDDAGESNTTAQLVTIGGRQVQEVTLSDPSPATPTVGQPTLFTVTPGTATNTPLKNVRIDFGDGNAEDLGAINGAVSVVHTFTSPGSYTVRATLTDTSGASRSSAKLVTVNPVTVTSSAASAAINTGFTFTALPPPNSSIDRYEWDFGSGSDQTVKNNNTVQKSYATVGTYTVTVKVYRTNGDLLGTATVIVRVTAT